MANNIGNNTQGKSWVELLRGLEQQNAMNNQEMNMLQNQPNTYLGMKSGELIGALLGRYLYPGQENGEVNTEGNAQAANDLYNERYGENGMSGDIAAQNNNTAWQEQSANAQAANQYDFGNADDWKKQNPIAQMKQDSNIDLLGQNVGNLSPEELRKYLLANMAVRR